MKLLSRLSFHHRIFVLVGLFAAFSISVMWFVVRPLYEQKVVEERTTIVQQIQHFAIHSVDKEIEQWIDIIQYIAWNTQTRPADISVLMRQQIAFDTSLIQIIIASEQLTDEYVVTNAARAGFSFVPKNDVWVQREKDSSLSILWTRDSASAVSILGIRKFFLIGKDIYSITMFADSRQILSQLSNLPIGGEYALQVGDKRNFIFSNTTIDFGIKEDEWKNLSVLKDVSIQGTQWNILFTKFSTLPMYLLIGIPKSVILQPVDDLLFYSGTIIIGLTFSIFIFGWIFSRQLAKPISQLVRDVERLSTLDFSQPISVPQLREIANVATTIESMRTVLERYQRINVEKIIFEEWKNKFFLSHSEDAICITDGSDGFSFMNDRFVQLKDSLHAVSSINKKNVLLNHQNIKRSKETNREETSGEYTILFHQMELEIDIPNAEQQYVRLHDVSIAHRSEKLGSLIVLHDLTNERMIDQMKTEMMNFIVHELRNPLNSIMGFASFVLDEPEMPIDERTQYVKIIKESSRTMNQLVNRFLDVQRLESRKVDYHTETTNLVAMAKLVCDSQKPQLTAKSIQLTFIAEENIPSTIVAPDLMREAFLNLVSNAIKYGDENRTIEVEMKKKEHDILFIITDHGFGISAEDQQKLFSKFFRVTSNKKAAVQIGTGLGLAHVKEVMTFHKGNVLLESNREIGCRFTLTIPIL